MIRTVFAGIICLIFLRLVPAETATTLSLAVSDLDAQGVAVNEAGVISEQLRAEFSKFSNFRLIERSQMNEILKEQGFQQTGCTSDACAVQVGQLLGVKNIAVGSVGKAGSYTVLSVRILDVATGEVVANKSMQTKGGIDKLLEGGIKTIAGDLYHVFFPEQIEVSKVEKPKTGKAAKIAAISGGALALVGGGVAAFLYLNREDNASGDNGTPEPNTRIELP